MQSVEDLKGQPKACVYTSDFDSLRDVGVEYASKLRKASNGVVWRHYDGLTHRWLQMTAWSREAVGGVARDLAGLCYGEK
jgi:acetyl esterase/lipase